MVKNSAAETEEALDANFVSAISFGHNFPKNYDFLLLIILNWKLKSLFLVFCEDLKHNLSS